MTWQRGSTDSSEPRGMSANKSAPSTASSSWTSRVCAVSAAPSPDSDMIFPDAPVNESEYTLGGLHDALAARSVSSAWSIQLREVAHGRQGNQAQVRSGTIGARASQ